MATRKVKHTATSKFFVSFKKFSCTMADESWVFDSLICFLHSPAWNAALNTFIEEKSLSKTETLEN